MERRIQSYYSAVRQLGYAAMAISIVLLSAGFILSGLFASSSLCRGLLVSLFLAALLLIAFHWSSISRFRGRSALTFYHQNQQQCRLAEKEKATTTTLVLQQRIQFLLWLFGPSLALTLIFTFTGASHYSIGLTMGLSIGAALGIILLTLARWFTLLYESELENTGE